MPRKRPPKPVFRQLMLDMGDDADQIGPTPCKKCGTRSLVKAPPPVPPGFTAADMFSEEFNAAAVSTFVCAGCGAERADAGDWPEP